MISGCAVSTQSGTSSETLESHKEEFAVFSIDGGKPRKILERGSGRIMTSLVAQTVKAAAYNAGDPAMGLIPGSGRSPGEGNGTPLQYSCLENPIDGGAWWATDHVVTESDTTERLHFLSLSLSRLICLATYESIHPSTHATDVC